MSRLWSICLIAWGLVFSIISAGAEDSADLSPHDRLMEKMLSLKIAAFDIRNASTAELVGYLQTVTKAADPAGVGIVFAFDPKRTDGWITHFSLNLKNTTLRKILDQLLDQDAVGYKVENDKITLWLIGDGGAEIRTLEVPSGFFGKSDDLYQEDKIDVEKDFQARGVDSSPRSSAVYSPSEGTVVVVGDPKYIEEVDETLTQFRIKRAAK